MYWMAILFTLTWILGWAAFLQSTYYSYLKTFVPDEEVQDKAAYCQLLWATGGMLTLVFAGIILATALV